LEHEGENMSISFQDALQNLINCHSMENGSDTPDFLLAEYLCDCLASYEVIVSKREAWYGREMRGPASAPTVVSSNEAKPSGSPIDLPVCEVDVMVGAGVNRL
jgi:hypothetical protein